MKLKVMHVNETRPFIPGLVAKWGDIFKIDNGYYILARASMESAVLISLSDGNRWEDAVAVHGGKGVSQDEFGHLTNGKVAIKVRSLQLSWEEE